MQACPGLGLSLPCLRLGASQGRNETMINHPNRNKPAAFLNGGIRFIAEKTIDGYDNATIDWNDADGNRYHAWFVRDRAKHNTIVNPFEFECATGCSFPSVYKNPPAGIKPGMPGYFRTRFLNVAQPKNQTIINAILETVDWPAARQKRIDEVQANRRKAAQERGEQEAATRLREAGPDLLAAARSVMAHRYCITDSAGRDETNASIAHALDRLSAAIGKAEG